MIYVTGIHALNLDCALDTCGDWHASSLRWGTPVIRESSESVLGEWGIEAERWLPGCYGPYAVANHLRALLDLLAEGDFSTAQGMREDFICNELYTPIVFEKTTLLQDADNWPEIDHFMEAEYGADWVSYRQKASQV